jgi:hypothetical protein
MITSHRVSLLVYDRHTGACRADLLALRLIALALPADHHAAQVHPPGHGGLGFTRTVLQLDLS